jgi:hypothetical protein
VTPSNAKKRLAAAWEIALLVTMRRLAFLVSISAATLVATASDFNSIVLDQIRAIPDGGGYATTREAHSALNFSVAPMGDSVSIIPVRARPSYCSGATYLALLKTLQAAEKSGRIAPLGETWSVILPKAASDGAGIWGRWNANGPGAARLFHELKLGRNFTEWSEARPGDFLKIFWTDAVGKSERGHLVVFLGEEEKNGVPHVRFWSSNKPNGYGEKSVAKSKIARAIFSRLENPDNIRNAATLPKKDDYLASLLRVESSFAEACRLSGITPP